jgi:hypothetical protein
MFWASNRTTTRKEGIDYCLLVTLDVNMPLLYGEGDKAFIRLQEKTRRASEGRTLFAWDLTTELLARGADFWRSLRRLSQTLGSAGPVRGGTPQSLMLRRMRAFRSSFHFICHSSHIACDLTLNWMSLRKSPNFILSTICGGGWLLEQGPHLPGTTALPGLRRQNSAV